MEAIAELEDTCLKLILGNAYKKFLFLDSPTVHLTFTTSKEESSLEAVFTCLVDSSPPATVRTVKSSFECLNFMKRI